MATDVIKLTRGPLVTEDVAKMTDEKMLRDIDTLLGYKPVGEAVRLQTVAAIFKKLDIEPFDSEKVDKYKTQMRQRHSRTRTDSYGDIHRTRASWDEIALTQYKKPVPAFALLRAMQVARELKKASIKHQFVVEELKSTTSVEKRERNLDPFMVLHVDNQVFYLDVWDEPKFEGRRTK